jgi:hypothetical protein
LSQTDRTRVWHPVLQETHSGEIIAAGPLCVSAIEQDGSASAKSSGESERALCALGAGLSARADQLRDGRERGREFSSGTHCSN